MKRLAIQRSWCKGCAICVAFCPKDALALDGEGKAHVKNPEACIFCGLCELRCPDLAIEIMEEEAAPGSCDCPVPSANARAGGSHE